MRCDWCDEIINEKEFYTTKHGYTHFKCMIEEQRLKDAAWERRELQDYESDLRDEEDSA